MSLSPFDSFQSRFVSYLLNFPRSMPSSSSSSLLGLNYNTCFFFIGQPRGGEDLPSFELEMLFLCIGVLLPFFGELLSLSTRCTWCWNHFLFIHILFYLNGVIVIIFLMLSFQYLPRLVYKLPSPPEYSFPQPVFLFHGFVL